MEKRLYDLYNQALHLVRKYMNLFFSHSLHQLIVEATKTSMCAKTLIDHILTNSPEKIIQRGVIEMGLFDHELMYCSRTTLVLNEHYEVLIKSTKCF